MEEIAEISDDVVVSLANINLSNVPKEKIHNGKKGNYVELTIVTKKRRDKDGNNGPVYVSQTAEERRQRAPKIYLGSTNVVDVKKYKDTAVSAPADGEPHEDDDELSLW